MANKYTLNPFNGNFDTISEVTLANVGSSPNANGASISASQELQLQPADGTNPGVLTASSQTIGGTKTFSAPVLISAGSASAPSLAFSTDAGQTGFFSDTADVIAMTIDQVNTWRFWRHNVVGGGPKIQGVNDAGGGTYWVNYTNDGFISVTGSTGTDFGRNIRLYGDGHASTPRLFEVRRDTTVDLQINNSGVATFGSSVLTGSGTAAAPALGWSADADGSGTGFFRGAADEVNISNAGTDTWRFARTTGPVLQGKNASAETTFFIQSQTDGALSLSGSSGSTTGRNQILYGSTHATKASVWELRSGTTVDISVASNGNTTFAGSILAANGTASAPSIGWSSDADGSGTGFYRNSANEIWMTNNGVDTWRFIDSSGPTIQGRNASAGTVSLFTSQTNGAIAVASGSANNSGRNIWAYGSTHATKANVLELSRGTTIDVSIDSSGNATFNSPILFSSGTASAPGIAFSADADGTGTGIFRGSANEINMAMNGTDTIRFARTTGPLIQGRNASAETTFFIQTQTDGALALSGSSGSGSGRNMFLYAQSHASNPGKLEVRSGTTVDLTLDSSANMGLGTATFGTSATKTMAIGTGTAPTTGPADTIQLYSTDLSAGNTIPSWYCEGSGVTNAGITNTTVTHKIAMRVNGTVFYLLATTNGT